MNVPRLTSLIAFYLEFQSNDVKKKKNRFNLILKGKFCSGYFFLWEIILNGKIHIF